MNQIILASASPRRKEILEMLDIDVIIRPSHAKEEIGECTNPKDIVKLLATQKAQAVSRTNQELIIAADTVVTIDDQILGKPKDWSDAAKMLKILSGREHSVFTGFCILKGETCIVDAEETKVTFRFLSDDTITEYLRTGEPFDKAGAYGIQGKGCLLIEKISGDYYNVVGLPVSRIMSIIKENHL
ncbi:MAG: septum formation inhibitor Maf [Ruminococcaceae bacterium]|nr:septum formation inhibitor Maf [Oscillospiraceae bacterium]